MTTRPAHRVDPGSLQASPSQHIPLRHFKQPFEHTFPTGLNSIKEQIPIEMSLQTPRILPAHLNAFHPSSSGPRSTHTVRILGTVTALRGDTATIACGSNGDVTLILKPDSHLQMGKLVEVVGKVADLEGGQVCIRVFLILFLL